MNVIASLQIGKQDDTLGTEDDAFRVLHFQLAIVLDAASGLVGLGDLEERVHRIAPRLLGACWPGGKSERIARSMWKGR